MEMLNIASKRDTSKFYGVGRSYGWVWVSSKFELNILA
jgi:hypothetical protein